MNYDDKIKRAEQIIAQLEQAEAIGMDEYKRLASEATALLQQCKAEIEITASSSIPSPAP